MAQLHVCVCLYVCVSWRVVLACCTQHTARVCSRGVVGAQQYLVNSQGDPAKKPLFLVELCDFVLVGIQDPLFDLTAARDSLVGVRAEELSEALLLVGRHMIWRERCIRESPRFHLRAEGLQTLADGVAHGRVPLAELGYELCVMRVLEHPEEVVIHEYLSGRVRPGANADCGNLEGLGDRRAHWCGDTLQDDRKRTRVLPSCARETR